MNPPRTLTQMAELLNERPATVRRALDRARQAGLPAPDPAGQAGNAATYDPAEFAVWWSLQRQSGRPTAEEGNEDPLALTGHHIEIARMLADWVRSRAGQEISIEARARQFDTFATLIERVARATGNTSEAVRDAITVLRSGVSPEARAIKFRVHQHFYRELRRDARDETYGRTEPETETG
jgi:hypothetical protein